MDDDRGRRAWALAETQHWLIKWIQLRALGYSEKEIRTRLRTKRLWLVYPGVYALGHPGMTPERERMAAVLACGEGAGLAHFSGSAHLELWEGALPPRIQVAIPTRNGRSGARRTGLDEDELRLLADRIEIRRPLRLDLIEHRGIPVTSISQTIVDLATHLKPWQLRGPLRQAERVHDFDLQTLHALVVDAPPTAWRAQRVRKALALILDDSGMTQTEREALYLDICKRYRLPQPRPQRPLGRARADFVHDELMLIIEIDDRASHDGHVAFSEDRKRDRANANRGFETLRFTVAECRREPKLVAADTRAAIARRVELLGLDPSAWGLGSNPRPSRGGYSTRVGGEGDVSAP